MKFLFKRSRTLVLTAALLPLLGGCGSSDILSYDQDTFFEKAMPTWLIPKIRDDYMGKKYLQPGQVISGAEHSETGEPIPESYEPKSWNWWWPWSD